MSEALAKIKTRIKACEQSKAPHRARWQTNIAFFEGYHYTRWSDKFGLVQPLGVEQWKVQLTMNYVRSVALVQAAKLTQNRPAWTVLPATDDQEDRDKARASQRLLDYIWEKQDCQQKLYESVLDSVLTGMGYWCLYWDPAAGEPYESQDPGEDTKTVGLTGFPRIEPATPFEIGIDPMAASIDVAAWGYRMRLVSVEWVKRRYRKMVEGRGTDNLGDELTPIEAGAKFLQQIEHAAEMRRGYVPYIEYYDIEKGRFTYLLPEHDIILDRGDWTTGLPFVQVRAIPNRGDMDLSGPASNKSLGATAISDIVEVQRELNRTESQLIEIKNLLAFPRILASRGAAIDPMSLVDRPGSQVVWSGIGPPPQPFHLGNVPGWVFQYADRLREVIRDLSGVHEVSQGQAPGSVQSGLAVRILAEQDAQRFAAHARSIAQAMRRAGILLLRMWRQHAAGPITLRVIGRSAALEISEFHEGSINSEDVYVQEGSTFAKNKDIRNEQIAQLFQIGLLDDPRKARRMMEFGDVEEAIGDMDVHLMKQRRELADLKEGRPAPVLPWQDHFVHLDELIHFMNSTTFERLDEERQNQIVEHWQAHMQIVQPQIQQERAAATQRGIAAAGSPRQDVISFPGPQGPSPAVGSPEGAGMPQGPMMER